jgi:hypothetical protein
MRPLELRALLHLHWNLFASQLRCDFKRGIAVVPILLQGVHYRELKLCGMCCLYCVREKETEMRSVGVPRQIYIS